jgi:hypothetical protein
MTFKVLYGHSYEFIIYIPMNPNRRIFTSLRVSTLESLAQ